MASQAQRAGTRADLYVRHLIQAVAPKLPYFAIRTKPKCDRMVREGLWGLGLEALSLKFFPSYVFARFHPERRLQIAQIRGIHSFVGCTATLTPIEDEELDAFQRIEEAKISSGPGPFPARGAPYVIHSGPLEGVRGVLVPSDREARLLVSLGALERSIAVIVDRDSIGPFRPSL